MGDILKNGTRITIEVFHDGDRNASITEIDVWDAHITDLIELFTSAAKGIGFSEQLVNEYLKEN